MFAGKIKDFVLDLTTPEISAKYPNGEETASRQTDGSSVLREKQESTTCKRS